MVERWKDFDLQFLPLVCWMRERFLGTKSFFILNLQKARSIDNTRFSGKEKTLLWLKAWCIILITTKKLIQEGFPWQGFLFYFMLNYNMNGTVKQDTECREIFKDFSKQGKDRKWKERKLSSLSLARRYDQLEEKCAQSVFDCANVMLFKEFEDGSRRLHRTFFCKNKLCAMCNWRRSMKYSYQASRIIDKAVEEHPNARFLFLTLTMKNVDGEELSDKMAEMTKGFNRLFKYKKVSKNILGYLRAMEVTYSKDRDDYHPHLHILIMVKSMYFKNSDNYISQEEWTSLWQKAMKLDYTPIVDIRALKKGVTEAIKETAKYPVKPFDVEAQNGDISEDKLLALTSELYNGLKMKRQIGFGGIFKEIKKQLELDDLEDGDLVNVDDSPEGVTVNTIVAQWDHSRNNYFVRQ